MDQIKVLLLGDIVGVPGCTIFQKHIDRLRNEHTIDAVIVNGENAATDGLGITQKLVRFFRHNGVDVVTSGNHVWNKKEIYDYLNEHHDLLRPANYPSGVPGVGITTFKCKEHLVAVINLQGRVFMRENLDCPFRTAQTLLTILKEQTKLIFIDFHAEATAEKLGLGYFLDGQITGMVGTHTHVLTADECIFSQGTAYISDLGMAGALNSMIGMKKNILIQRFLTQLPVRFVVETEGPFIMTGVLITADTRTGKATEIKRITVVDDDITL
ncbi:TIGR00282 family metallophosphoesterase [Candidatus Dependentiae bacterium]|nr:MAG: TIGR00282 family metallophosphoesterase [Candidatus Dependentiae bacterium]